MDTLCTFDNAWIGKCKKPMPCKEHQNLLCESCKKSATHSCAETGQFVCGSYLCDDCEHTIFPEGHNGGIGFNAQPVPEGMKRHCKKTAQKYLPWYARDATK